MVQEIWVCERLNVEDSDILISVYENEMDALENATESALERMTDMQCDVSSSVIPSSWHSAFNLFLAEKQAGNFRIALGIYAGWNCSIDIDNAYSICVYSTDLISNKTQPYCTHAPRNRMLGVQIPSPALHNKDVACKQCGRNVNSSEDTCWYCGIKDPAC